MLIDYIEQYKIIYGKDSITSNVHNLCHLVDDVKRFGPLPTISAYPFENRLNYIKRLLRNGNRPLAQVAKRLNELSHSENKKKILVKYPKLSKEKKSDTSAKMYNSIEIKDGFLLRKDKKNKWFLTKDNDVVEFQYAIPADGCIFVYGETLKKLNNFFDRPFNSSRINIFCSSAKKNSISSFQLSDIKCKLFSLPYKQQFVFIPIIHT